MQVPPSPVGTAPTASSSEPATLTSTATDAGFVEVPPTAGDPTAISEASKEVLLMWRNVGWFGIAIALAMILVLRLALPDKARKQLRTPMLLLGAHVMMRIGWVLLPDSSAAKLPLYLAALLTLLLSIGRTGFLLTFDVVLGRRVLQPLPTIIRDILQGLIYAFAGLVTLRAAGIEASSLLTTSALLTAVVGLSLQDTLGNVFAGLAIQAQRPFEVGDWIQYDERPEHVGHVVEINWRATKVLTLDDVEVVIPNGLLAKVAIRNFTKPTPLMRRSIFVDCPYDVHPAHVQQVICSGLRSAPRVENDPEPTVLVREFGERGVRYWVRYYTTNFQLSEATDADVRTRIWYALHRAHIPIPYPVQTIVMPGLESEAEPRRERINARRREEALRRVEIFSALPNDALKALAERADNRLYGDGEYIIRQGDEGDELFVIEHGEVVVLHNVDPEPGAPADSTPSPTAELARLGLGDFFGEMSLMTGAKRAASVRTIGECDVLVVDKDGFREMLDMHPEVLEDVSRLLARRQDRIDSRSGAGPTSRRRADRGGVLLGRIKNFFSLK